MDEVTVQILALDMLPDQMADHLHKKCASLVILKNARSLTAQKTTLQTLCTLIRKTMQSKKENLASPAAKAK